MNYRSRRWKGATVAAPQGERLTRVEEKLVAVQTGITDIKALLQAKPSVSCQRRTVIGAISRGNLTIVPVSRLDVGDAGLHRDSFSFTRVSRSPCGAARQLRLFHRLDPVVHRAGPPSEQAGLAMK